MIYSQEVAVKLTQLNALQNKEIRESKTPVTEMWVSNLPFWRDYYDKK